MPDSGFILPPAFRVATDAMAVVAGGRLEFYLAGTNTATNVYSDSGLVTSLGSTVYLDSGGHPVASQGSSTKVIIYTGSALIKIVVKDSAGVTLATYDNVKATEDTSSFLTGATGGFTGVLSRTADFTVTAAHDGKLFNVDPTSAQVGATLPSASTVGDGFTVGFRHNGTTTTNAVVVSAVSGQPIAHANTTALTHVLTGGGEVVWLQSNGASWIVHDHTGPRAPVPQPIVIADRLTAPPASPAAGAFYLISGTPTGTWSTLSFQQHDIVRANGIGGWTLYRPFADCGWIAYVADEDLVTQYRSSAWVDWSNITAPTSTVRKCVILQHQQANGTNGGVNTSGTRQTYPLNTFVNSAASNVISGATFSSNTLSDLPAGTYRITGWAVFTGVEGVQLFWRNSTTATDVVVGGSFRVPNGTSARGHAWLDGVFTVGTSTDDYILQYRTENNFGTNAALGDATSFSEGAEIYAHLHIEDMALSQGPQGPQGPQGVDGLDAAHAYQWSTSTSGDPGTGKISINNATPAAATRVFIADTTVYGGSMTNVINSWDDGTSTTAKGRLKFSREGAAQNFMEFLVTGAVIDQGAYFEIPVSYVNNSGTISSGNDLAVIFIDKGDKGDTGSAGATGATGATGSAGPTVAIGFNFSSTTTDSAPGSGSFRLNNATAASATTAYFDNNERGGTNVSAWLDTFDDSGNASLRGVLLLTDPAASTTFRIYNVTGSVVDGTGYRKVTIAHVAGNGSFTNGNQVSVWFLPRGPAGDGDLSSANNLSDLASPKTGYDNISVNGSDVASASTIDLDSATGNLVDVTGTTTITAITLSSGRERTVRFTGALTLTHGASLVLPGGANITTAAGDFAIFRGYAAGVVRCVLYTKATGKAVITTVTASDISASVLAALAFGPFTSIASATTTDLSTVATIGATITGTTTITSLGTGANLLRVVKFSGALTLTHNATTLILPGGANITTAADDTAILLSDGSGNWTCVSYQKASGKAVVTTVTASDISAAVLAALAFGPFTSIASASTTDLSTVATIGASITGTTTITSFGTGANLLRIGKFAGALTLTHNATSLILPGGANITTAAGDRFIALSDGSGNWTVVNYTKANGTPIIFDWGTSQVVKFGTAEIGHASDTTLARVSAGLVSIEGTTLGWLEVPQNSKSAAYTTVLSDSGKHILHPSSDNNARTFTIDSNANVAYPVGTVLTFINMINTVTISITSDTMTLLPAGTTGSRTLAANGIATAVKIASTSWVISGTGLT